jgi:hypothetical protein
MQTSEDIIITDVKKGGIYTGRNGCFYCILDVTKHKANAIEINTIPTTGTSEHYYVGCNAIPLSAHHRAVSLPTSDLQRSINEGEIVPLNLHGEDREVGYIHPLFAHTYERTALASLFRHGVKVYRGLSIDVKIVEVSKNGIFIHETVNYPSRWREILNLGPATFRRMVTPEFLLSNTKLFP